jgi:hypothetical protein
MPTLVAPRVLPGVALFVALLAWTPAVRAQESANVTAPAHIAYVDGTVMLERDGAVDTATVNVPIVAGDRLRTTVGRIELLFPDGSALAVDEHSSLDVLSPTLLRLVAGRAMMLVAGASDPSAAVRYQIDTPVASVRTDGPGEFRVAVLGSRDGETELAVVRGVANLATERGEVAVRAGERTVAFENGAPLSPQTFNSARFDAFDRWVAGRRDARLAASSAQYLPRELQTYGGTLDRYGSWQYTEPYGHVWYPTVAASWRPYYYGSWSPIRSYGWTWIGVDLWSWPTHHYGRWGHANRGWFWSPGRTWGPAWVSWAAAPGYVSWCPLGFDGRPVFALSLGVGDPWAGWTVVPRRSFGSRNYYVNRYAVQPHRFPRTTPFIVQSVAPVAVPRYAGGSPASAELGRRVRAGDSGSPVGADNQPGAFARRSGTVDRDAGRRERAVPRSSSPDDRSPASSAAIQSGARDARDWSTGRRQDPDSPAATRDFRQPLPDVRRERAVERASPTAPRPADVGGSSLQNGDPRGPSRDPRLFSTNPPSVGVGRRPSSGEVSPPRDDGFGRAVAPGRRIGDERPLTIDRPRAPEIATPRYRTPGAAPPAPAPERPAQSPPPSWGAIQRSRPVDRAPSAAPESRGPAAAPRSAPEGSRPAGRVESGARSAPSGGESRGERAVPRGPGSPRGAGRRQ